MDNKFFKFLATYEADLKVFFEALVNFIITIFEIGKAEEAPEA